MALPKNDAFVFNDTKIQPGERASMDLIVGQLYTHTPVSMSVEVFNGKYAGPTIFVSAAIHGDELNGIEIIRRLLRLPALKRLRGTLIAIPIVNVLSVVHGSRYLPDRRDLNRCFPGTKKGSLASRMANTFMTQVVKKCDYGIDLHTGAIHRSNFPQIRASITDKDMQNLAMAFDAPVIINSGLTKGTLRTAAAKKKIPVITYEAGEALRFDETGIRGGVKGIVNVMRFIGMLPKVKKKETHKKPVIAVENRWVRAPESGIYHSTLKLGAHVSKGQMLGTISSPYSDKEINIISPHSGLVIGMTKLPLVHGGDAVMHIARVEKPKLAKAKVQAFMQRHSTPGITTRRK
ncbi:MAG: succinylglutamate desuccinylase [Gammaproteobacteria bacterium]|nr:succinylglutamate desuccinylase [Gammaproteobacteria bacterium]NNM14058.1 succinylglutamate desuccinylase [Gammaproteobacteria bacterium]